MSTYELDNSRFESRDTAVTCRIKTRLNADRPFLPVIGCVSRFSVSNRLALPVYLLHFYLAGCVVQIVLILRRRYPGKCFTHRLSSTRYIE